jgi:hypothetical protein
MSTKVFTLITNKIFRRTSKSMRQNISPLYHFPQLCLEETGSNRRGAFPIPVILSQTVTQDSCINQTEEREDCSEDAPEFVKDMATGRDGLQLLACGSRILITDGADGSPTHGCPCCYNPWIGPSTAIQPASSAKNIARKLRWATMPVRHQNSDRVPETA